MSALNEGCRIVASVSNDIDGLHAGSAIDDRCGCLMSMISDATKILVVTTQFSVSRIPGRIWRMIHKAYNPWIEPSHRLPRNGEAVECRFQPGRGESMIAWCFPRLSLSGAGSPVQAATWYMNGPGGEQKLASSPVSWRRIRRRRRAATKT